MSKRNRKPEKHYDDRSERRRSRIRRGAGGAFFRFFVSIALLFTACLFLYIFVLQGSFKTPEFVGAVVNNAIATPQPTVVPEQIPTEAQLIGQNTMATTPVGGHLDSSGITIGVQGEGSVVVSGFVCAGPGIPTKGQICLLLTGASTQFTFAVGEADAMQSVEVPFLARIDLAGIPSGDYALSAMVLGEVSALTSAEKGPTLTVN